MQERNEMQEVKKGLFANARYRKLKHQVFEEFSKQGLLIWLYVWFRWSVSPYFELARKIPSCSSVIDMGCGFGLLAACCQALQLDVSYTGLDLDRRRITIATECLQNNRTTFLEKDWYAYKAKDINVFVFFDVLHHLPEDEQKKILEHCYLQLSDNGVVLIKDVGTEPRWKYFVNALFDFSTGLFGVTLGQKPHYRSVQDWMRLGEALGYVVDELEIQHKDYAPHILVRLKKECKWHKN